MPVNPAARPTSLALSAAATRVRDKGFGKGMVTIKKGLGIKCVNKEKRVNQEMRVNVGEKDER